MFDSDSFLQFLIRPPVELQLSEISHSVLKSYALDKKQRKLVLDSKYRLLQELARSCVTRAEFQAVTGFTKRSAQRYFGQARILQECFSSHDSDSRQNSALPPENHYQYQLFSQIAMSETEESNSSQFVQESKIFVIFIFFA